MKPHARLWLDDWFAIFNLDEVWRGKDRNRLAYTFHVLRWSFGVGEKRGLWESGAHNVCPVSVKATLGWDTENTQSRRSLYYYKHLCSTSLVLEHHYVLPYSVHFNNIQMGESHEHRRKIKTAPKNLISPQINREKKNVLIFLFLYIYIYIFFFLYLFKLLLFLVPLRCFVIIFRVNIIHTFIPPIVSSLL